MKRRKDGQPDGRHKNRPPRENRFQKGQSGNPRGRPREYRSLDELIGRHAERWRTMSSRGQKQRRPNVGWMIEQLFADAMRGSWPNRRFYFERYGRYLDSQAAATPSSEEGPIVVPAYPGSPLSGRMVTYEVTEREMARILEHGDEMERALREHGAYTEEEWEEERRRMRAEYQESERARLRGESDPVWGGGRHRYPGR